MRILSKHRESTGLSRSHLEGSDPVGKDTPRFAHLFSCRSTPFFSTFAHRLRAERGDARAHSRKRKWAHSAQFWCNLSPLDATLTKNRGVGDPSLLPCLTSSSIITRHAPSPLCPEAPNWA